MSTLMEIRERGGDTRLIRSRTGRKVHRYGCPWAGKNWVPWTWAENRPDADWLRIPWLTPCGRCYPEQAASTDGEDAQATKGTVV